MSLRKEIQEFVDAITSAYADKKITLNEAYTISCEGFDVISEVVVLDSSPENRDELAAQIEVAANQLVDRLNIQGFLVRNIVLHIASNASDRLVEAAASHAGTAREYWRDNVNPVLFQIENGCHRLRQIGGEV